MPKVIAKCYDCGSNRIVDTSVESFQCTSCNKTLNYEKAKILCKPTDNEDELREKLFDLRSQNSDSSVDFSVSTDKVKEANSDGVSEEKYVLNIIKKEGPINQEVLEEICEKSRGMDKKKVEEIVQYYINEARIYKVPKKGLKIA